jgi:hypothetical protein
VKEDHWLPTLVNADETGNRERVFGTVTLPAAASRYQTNKRTGMEGTFPSARHCNSSSAGDASSRPQGWQIVTSERAPIPMNHPCKRCLSRRVWSVEMRTIGSLLPFLEQVLVRCNTPYSCLVVMPTGISLYHAIEYLSPVCPSTA